MQFHKGIRIMGVLLVLATAAGCKTFIVTSAADTDDINPGNGKCEDANGQCTVRAAVQEANATLASVGTVTIELGEFYTTFTSQPPSITRDNVVIDGLKIPGTTCAGADGKPVLLATLDFNGFSTGMWIGANDVTVKGLVAMNGGNSGAGIFATGANDLITCNEVLQNANGIEVIQSATQTTVSENYIHHNSANGVQVFGSNTTVLHNLTENNTGFGISVDGVATGFAVSRNTVNKNGTGLIIAGSNGMVQLNTVTNSPNGGGIIPGSYIDFDDNSVSANAFGLAIAGTSPVGNSFERNSIVENTLDGFILLGAATANNVIGDINPLNGNTIAFNGGNGISTYDPSGMNGPAGVGNMIINNAIYGNGILGIHLTTAEFPAADSSTPLPNDDGDSDAGPNGLQNYPVITSATSDSVTVTIAGTLNSTPGTTFEVEVYGNDPGATVAEGQYPIGVVSITTDNSGNAAWTISAPAGSWTIVTATATGPDGTSEFSLGVDTGS